MGIFSQTREAVNLAEKRDSLLQIMAMPGWNVVESILREVRELPLKTLDDKSVADLLPNEVGHIKGMREAINLIEKKIDFIINGK